MEIHDIYDVRGTAEMKDILCVETITWATGTTKQLFGNWVCDMIQIKVPTDINNFIDGLLKSNEGISQTVRMLMNDTERHILSAQAHALVVSLDAQDQCPQKGGVPNPTQKSAQINYPQEYQDDHKNLKHLTSIYTGILKTESLQLEATSTPPELGGNIAEPNTVDVFREWNLEYEHGKIVLQNCRNEFLNRARTQTSQHFKLSNYFLLHTLDGLTE